MIIFPSLLAAHIGELFPVPQGDWDELDVDAIKDQYPHWAIYLKLHCCCPIKVGSLGTNAQALARIPADQLRTMTVKDFMDAGLDLVLRDPIPYPMQRRRK